MPAWTDLLPTRSLPEVRFDTGTALERGSPMQAFRKAAPARKDSTEMKRRAVQLGALSVVVTLLAAGAWQTRGLWSSDQQTGNPGEVAAQTKGDPQVPDSASKGHPDPLAAPVDLTPRAGFPPASDARRPFRMRDTRRAGGGLELASLPPQRSAADEALSAALRTTEKSAAALDGPSAAVEQVSTTGGMTPSPAQVGLAPRAPLEEGDDGVLARGQSPGQSSPTLAGSNPLRGVGEATDEIPPFAPQGGRPAPTPREAFAKPPTTPPATLPSGGGARPIAAPAAAVPPPQGGRMPSEPSWSGVPTADLNSPPSGTAAAGSTFPSAPRGGGQLPPRSETFSRDPESPRMARGTPANRRSDLANLGPPVYADPPGRGAVGFPNAPTAQSSGGRPGDQALEGLQQAQVTVEKIAPAEIQVGKLATFEIHIHNIGRTPAKGIQVIDAVPQGTQLRGTSPRADHAAAGKIIWNVDTLAPGEERAFEVQLMPQQEGDIGSVAMIQFAAQASVRTRCTKAELQLHTTAPRKVMVGDQQVISIEIHNPGTGDATGVMLIENVPQGMSHTHGQSLEFEVGTLRAGETKESELVLTAEQAGLIENRLLARADANLQTEAVCQFEVIAPALQVAVSGPQRRYLERPATYRLQMQNPGTASAHDVELVSHLPKGMQFVRANNMGEYDPATHSVYWSLAELPANQTADVELEMLPTEPGQQKILVESKADQGLVDRAEQAVVVEGLAAIKIEVVDLQDPIEVGSETTYEIRIENQGTKAATHVEVAAVLPPGLSFVAAEGPTDYQQGPGRVLFNPLEMLAPKADTTFRINVQGVRSGDQRFRVQILTAELGQRPISEEENTTVYADQ